MVPLAKRRNALGTETRGDNSHFQVLIKIAVASENAWGDVWDATEVSRLRERERQVGVS